MEHLPCHSQVQTVLVRMAPFKPSQLPEHAGKPLVPITDAHKHPRVKRRDWNSHDLFHERYMEEKPGDTQGLGHPQLHQGPTSSSTLQPPSTVQRSPHCPCQAGSDPFSLPDGSDPREAADKQSFHCLVKDNPIPCHSSSIFRKNKKVLFQTSHSASWNDAFDEGRQGWQKNELLHKDGVSVHFCSRRERHGHSTKRLLDAVVAAM